MIKRPRILKEIADSLKTYPITTLLGPRQCGKSTLAHQLDTPARNFFDLEDPLDRARLEGNPRGVLGDLDGLIILDEVQRMPTLFPLLRVLADRSDSGARFLLLGSVSPHLVRDVSESLAGRVRFISMSGFSIKEVGIENKNKRWFRGGFPRSYLATSEKESSQWRSGFIETFLTRDVPQLISTKLTDAQRRNLLTLIAHYHGQSWNTNKAGDIIDVNNNTIQRYLEIFSGSYIVRLLPPYLKNTAKRLRKGPKMYLRDSGLLHELLHIKKFEQLFGHPQLGASWEGFCMETIIQLFDIEERQLHYWGTQGGAELDLVVETEGKTFGFEFKYKQSPKTTKSMQVACQDLDLDKLFVIYPGEKDFSLSEKIQAVGFDNLPELYLDQI